MIKFGDVFVFGGKNYIFLAATEEIIYTARILDRVGEDGKNAEELKKRREYLSCKIGKGSQMTSNDIIYCFVVLKTEKFKEQIAHLKDSQSGKNINDIVVESVIGSVDENDLQQLEEEVKKGPVAIQLKELIKANSVTKK